MWCEYFLGHLLKYLPGLFLATTIPEIYYLIFPNINMSFEKGALQMINGWQFVADLAIDLFNRVVERKAKIEKRKAENKQCLLRQAILLSFLFYVLLQHRDTSSGRSRDLKTSEQFSDSKKRISLNYSCAQPEQHLIEKHSQARVNIGCIHIHTMYTLY